MNQLIYIFIVTIFLLLVIQLILFTITQKKLLSITGIPLSLPFPIRNLQLIDERNYFLCVSIDCPQCQNIIKKLYKSNIDQENVFLVFTEDEQKVYEYLESFPDKNMHIKYLTIKPELLFLTVTPFVYLVNKEGVVVNKKAFNKLKQLNIPV